MTQNFFRKSMAAYFYRIELRNKHYAKAFQRISKFAVFYMTRDISSSLMEYRVFKGFQWFTTSVSSFVNWTKQRTLDRNRYSKRYTFASTQDFNRSISELRVRFLSFHRLLKILCSISCGVLLGFPNTRYLLMFPKDVIQWLRHCWKSIDVTERKFQISMSFFSSRLFDYITYIPIISMLCFVSRWLTTRKCHEYV